MNIRFLELSLHNFMSYSDVTLRLDNRGYVLVQGKNNNKVDLAQSNGSGKSALFEGISYALTGETIRGSKDVVNLNGDGSCEVTLKFLSDSDEYIVCRGKNGAKSSLSMYINGEDKSAKGVRDTEKVLDTYLPYATPSFLGSVITLGQGLPQRFSNNTPSGRKEVLEVLSKSDFMLSDLKDRVAKRKEKLQAEQLELNKNIAELDGWIKFSQEKLYTFLNEIRELSDMSSIEKEQKEANLRRVVLERDLDLIDPELTELAKQEQRCLDEHARQNDQYLFEHETIIKKYEEQENSLKSEELELGFTTTTKSKELSRLESVGTVCPTCGREMEQPSEETLNTLRNELSKLNEELSIVKGNLDSVRKSKSSDIANLGVKFEQDKKRIGEQVRLIRDRKSELTSKQTKARNDLLDVQKELADINTKLSSRQETIQRRTEESNLLESELGSKLQLMDNTKKLLDENTTRQGIIQKFNTLLTRDFRGVLLENVINCINSFASQYSRKLFDVEKVHLALDGNDLDILFDNRSYESLSTGERLKCDIIIQLSIRKMLCEYLNFSCNIIVLDELFDGLDKLGCERVIDLLFTELDDISSTFVITHRADLPITCDETIIVEKNNQGISELK